MKRWIPMLSMILLLSLHAVALACPNCKGSIPNSDAEAGSSLPSGFNYSIYYMLGSLFAVMGLVGTVIVKGIRSSARLQAQRSIQTS